MDRKVSNAPCLPIAEITSDDNKTPFVLLIDDDEDQLFLFRALLERENCVVVTATSAEAALDILRDVHIDLVVCDVNMPRTDGRQFISRVRKASDLTRLPVIAFSALPDYAEEDLLACGADVFCYKAETRNLLRQVAQLLSQNTATMSLLSQVRDRFSQ